MSDFDKPTRSEAEADKFFDDLWHDTFAANMRNGKSEHEAAARADAACQDTINFDRRPK